MRHTPEYKAWAEMKYRCDNPGSNRYKTYGSRGIKVHPDWYSFINFYRDMGARPTDSHSLHRINNDLGYSKENCKWALPAEQMNATSRNLVVDIGDQKLTLAELSRTTGIEYRCLHARVVRGRNDLLAPSLATKPSLRSKALKAGIPYLTVYSRIKKLGWSEEKALSTPRI